MKTMTQEEQEKLQEVLNDLDKQKDVAREYYSQTHTKQENKDMEAAVAQDIKEKELDKADLEYYREVETKRQDERIARAAEDVAFQDSRETPGEVDKLTQASVEAREEAEE